MYLSHRSRLRLIALIICLMALSQTAAAAVADTNFPPGTNFEDSVPGKGVVITRWVSGFGWPDTVPSLELSQRPSLSTLDYLGFIAGQGSLVVDERDGNVCVYNHQTHSVEKKYQSKDDIPPEVLASLANRKYIYTTQHEALQTLPLKPAAGATAARSQEADSHLPPANVLMTRQDALLIWAPSPAPTQPLNILLRKPELAGAGLYLGFNDRGSWVAAVTNGKIYLWNWPANTLTQAADNWWEVPLDLHNPSPLMTALIYNREHAYTAQAPNGRVPDPNFPPSIAVEGAQAALPVRWTYPVADGPPTVLFAAGLERARYLGFDERGAWLWNPNFGIVAWNFATLKLTAIARAPRDVPQEARARVRNADPTFQAGGEFQGIRR